MNRMTTVSCLLFALGTFAGCSDDDDVIAPPPNDAMIDQTSDGAASDGSPQVDATTPDSDPIDVITADGGTTDGDTTGDAADAAINDGPGGDGSLILGSDSGPDGGTADARFALRNAVGANLLSSSDVRPDCTVATSGPEGNYVLTCEERSGTAGPCRTVELLFRINPLSGPRTGDRYPTLMKAAPEVGEAVVHYRESIDCTPATTNGWFQAQPGGDLTVNLGGDTAMEFTLHDVAMGPAPRGALNQNAQGTFTLSGTGTGFGSFQYR